MGRTGSLVWQPGQGNPAVCRVCSAIASIGDSRSSLAMLENVTNAPLVCYLWTLGFKLLINN